jgi:Fic family protein
MPLNATALEPAFPEQHTAPLENLACEVLLKAGQLQQRLQPQLRNELIGITRFMHCYYSNLIEGQQTLLPDIEAALAGKYSQEPKKRDLQKLALAHMETQKWAASYNGSPFEEGFLCDLHRHFYGLLPESLRVATTQSGAEAPLEAGELRQCDVKVGAHVAPPHELVPALLRHFRNRYESQDGSLATRIVAIGASHHRLAWIHPFRDGNGRVVRLFSDVLIRRLGIDSGGLWSLSRGLAFSRAEYYERLANADQERSSNSAEDGRGHLSERALREFCEYVLKVMLDQIGFMDALFAFDTLSERIEQYIRTESGLGEECDRAVQLLKEALYRGEFPRGEAGRITGTSERTGRATLSALVKDGLLKSETPKSPVRLSLPSKVLGTYFPRLYNPGYKLS